MELTLPKKSVTSVDVARAAGVSQSTVSRVFRNGASVKPALKERILEAAASLGYTPNKLASAMISGKSHAIGLVVAYLDNPFYADAVERLSAALKVHGYHIILFSAGNDEKDVDAVVQDLVEHQVDGMILLSVSTNLSLTAKINQLGIPCVLFNRGQFDGPLPIVSSGNFDGGKRAAEYFLSTGHQRIAHVSGWLGSSTGVDRMNGFGEGMKAAPDKFIGNFDCKYDRDTAIQITRDLFAKGNPPDGIFVGNDHMAFAVLEALRHDLNVKVPDDVSVIGFDDLQMSAWRDFNLTTFRQPINRMVEATVGILMALINEETPEKLKVVLESPFIERGTTKARS